MNKLKSILSIVLLSMMFSCGPKAVSSKDDIVKESIIYTSKIDSKKNLKEEITEGALTDEEGFKDIGTFKYTVYFDERSNELFKITNVEKTDKTISETYYFKDGKLFVIKINENQSERTKVYGGNLENSKSDEHKFYIKKARRFKSDFEKSY